MKHLKTKYVDTSQSRKWTEFVDDRCSVSSWRNLSFLALYTYVCHQRIFSNAGDSLSVGTIASSNEHMKTLGNKGPNGDPIATPSNWI